MSRRMVYPLLMLATVVAGCGSTADKSTPDDSGSFTVHCNKSSVRWNDCYETAARLCGDNGYQIVSEDDSSMPTVTTNMYQVPVIGGSMVIRCNQ